MFGESTGSLGALTGGTPGSERGGREGDALSPLSFPSDVNANAFGSVRNPSSKVEAAQDGDDDQGDDGIPSVPRVVESGSSGDEIRPARDSAVVNDGNETVASAPVQADAAGGVRAPTHAVGGAHKATEVRDPRAREGGVEVRVPAGGDVLMRRQTSGGFADDGTDGQNAGVDVG